MVATAQESKNFLEKEAELVAGLLAAAVLGCASGVAGSVVAPDPLPIAAAVEATQGHAMRSAEGATALAHGKKSLLQKAMKMGIFVYVSVMHTYISYFLASNPCF